MKKMLLLTVTVLALISCDNSSSEKTLEERSSRQEREYQLEQKAARCYDKNEDKILVEPEYLHEYFPADKDMRVVFFNFDNYDDYAASFFSNGKNSMYGKHLRQFINENPDLIFQSSCPSVPDDQGKGKGYITYWKKDPNYKEQVIAQKGRRVYPALFLYKKSLCEERFI